jgi:hypothetical protein
LSMLQSARRAKASIEIRAVKIIATTGQYILLAPLFPIAVLWWVAEEIEDFCKWAAKDRRWAMKLIELEDALDAWRSRSVASLSSSSISQAEASRSASTSQER